MGLKCELYVTFLATVLFFVLHKATGMKEITATLQKIMREWSSNSHDKKKLYFCKTEVSSLAE